MTQSALIALPASVLTVEIGCSLAQDGYALTLIDKAEPELRWAATRLAERGVDVVAECLDISEIEDAAIAVRIAREAGRLQAVVTGACVQEAQDEAAGSREAIAAGWRARLAGVTNLLNATVPEMRRNRTGVIVTIADARGASPGCTSLTEDAVLRAAIVGLTRALAVDLGASGIRAVAIAPGHIDGLEGAHSPSEIPMRRVGKPAEVAELCRFLVSDYASAVTGVDVTIDGGLAAVNHAFSTQPDNHRHA